MKRLLNLFSIVLFSSACMYLCSCSTPGGLAKENSDNFLKLKIGDSKSRVLSVMEKPHRNEKYILDGKEYDIWYY